MVSVVLFRKYMVMTSSGFYPPHGHYGASGHCGLPPSNLYSNNTNVHLNCEIPDQSMGNEWPQSLGNIGIGQKLDRLLKLMEDQKKETSVMKSDISILKDEVKEVRSANAATVESLKRTPKSTKLPTELSVSYKSVISYCVNCALIVLFIIKFDGCCHVSETGSAGSYLFLMYTDFYCACIVLIPPSIICIMLVLPCSLREYFQG